MHNVRNFIELLVLAYVIKATMKECFLLQRNELDRIREIGVAKYN